MISPKSIRIAKASQREVSPSGNRAPKDFINIGERGDPTLYDNFDTPDNDIPKVNKNKTSYKGHSTP
jgi:hypothetical protein